MKQVCEVVNSLTAQIMGEAAITTTDLSNIVDIGEAIMNAESYDKFTKALPDAINKVIFVDRTYRAKTFGLYRDAIEWGAITEKIAADLPDAAESEDWALTDGQSYDPNVFHKPDVSVKFFNKFVTYTIPYSIARKQCKSAFSGAGPFMAFMNMLETAVKNSYELKMESLARSTVSNLMAEVIHNNGKNVVKVLTAFNAAYPNANLTQANYMYSPDFWRFFSNIIRVTSDHMEDYSTLFNVAGAKRFTPKAKQNILLLSDAKSYINTYLQSDVFHNEFTSLPAANGINYWQGSGTDGFGFADISKLDVKTASGDTVTKAHVLGGIFDYDAAGITELERETRAQYNGRADFTNYWHEWSAGYRNDLAENAVVFVAE